MRGHPGLCRAPAGSSSRDERSERSLKREFLSLTSQPPRVGDVAVLVKESWASVQRRSEPPFGTPHIPWSFPAKGDWYLRQVAPFPGPGPEMLSAAAAQAQAKLVGNSENSPEVMLTHRGRTQRHKSCCVNGCLVEGGAVC